MQTEHTLKSELEILDNILGPSDQTACKGFWSQVQLLFSRMNKAKADSHWEHKAIQKILLKLVILQDIKNLPLSKGQLSFVVQESLISFTKFCRVSKLKDGFIKIIEKFLVKKKFAKSPKATLLLSKVAAFKTALTPAVLKEAKAAASALEKKKAVLSPAYLPFLDSDFVETHSVPLICKLLRKSMKHLPKIHKFLSGLEDISGVSAEQKAVLAGFLKILESNICAGLTKEPALQKEVFAIGGLLLSSLSENVSEALSKSIITFLNECKNKLRIKKEDLLMLGYSKLLMSLRGAHSAKLVTAVVDGLWLAITNCKEETSKQAIISRMFMLHRVSSLEAVASALASKMKEKKDVVIAAPVMMSYLCHYSVFRREKGGVSGERTSVLEDLTLANVALQNSITKRSEELIRGFPNSAPLNFANFHALLHAGFYYTLGRRLSQNLSREIKLPELPRSIPDLVQTLTDLNSASKNTIKEDPMTSKIVKILFNRNSIFFRNSLFDHIDAWDALALLRLIRLLEPELTLHLTSEKILDVASLLVLQLFSSVLKSSSRNLLFTRGRYIRMVSSLKKKNLAPQVAELAVKSQGVHCAQTNLLSDFVARLLVRGAFLVCTGDRFRLEDHRNLQDLWRLCEYQNADLVRLSASNELTPLNEPLPLLFQLAWLQSLVEFDFEPSASLTQQFTRVKTDPISKLVDLLSNQTVSVSPAHRSLSAYLAPIKAFLEDNPEQFDDFWCRLFSCYGVFSHHFTTRLFACRFLALLTCVAPEVLVSRLKWLLAPNNLRMLTRIKRISDHIAARDCVSRPTETFKPEHISEHMSFLLQPLYSTQQSTKALSRFGIRDPEDMTVTLEAKNFPSGQELVEERPDLFEYCAEQASLEETEEEQMAGLELLPEKDLILSGYKHILECLTFFTSEIFDFSSHLTEAEQTSLAAQFRGLQPNLLANANDSQSLMRPALRPVFENVYKLSCRGNGVEPMVSLFFNMLNGDVSSQFRQKLEKTCEGLTTEECYLQPHLFSIFFRTLQYLVEQGLSANAKKQVLGIVVEMAKRFEDKFGEKVFFFLARNMNHFYFDFAFTNLDQMFVVQLDKNDPESESMNILFGNLIDYQDYARKNIMTILLGLKSKISNSQMKISPLNKLKLRFLSRDEDSEVIEPALSLLECSNLKFDMNSFEELNFEEMLLDLPFDTQDTFALIFADLHRNLSSAQKNSFLETFQSTLCKAIKHESCMGLLPAKFERQLGLFPKILSSISDNIKDTALLRLFDAFNEVERAGFGRLTESVVALGRDLINKNPSNLGKLISAQALQIRASEPLISPIVFVAECAKVNPRLASQVSDLEEDLKRLLAVRDNDFLRRLAKQLRHLTAFIREPESWFKKLFKGVMEGKAGDSLLGSCYFTAGLLKGLGVKYLKSFKLIEKMEKPFLYSVKKDFKDVPLKVRQGCSLLAEALWDVFDRLLEPSLERLLQFLTKLLGDTNKGVRERTRLVMNKVMGRISEFGIKRILPVLLKGAADKNSKTKFNAILALGSIANCGTRQLSKNLPTIVPTLTDAINDTNEQVNSAAKRSLSLILGTIRNPEVSSLRDVLIKSLSDPFNHNERALDALLKTRFAHSLDGPSLSLIVPIALYGCKVISSESSKIKASQLIASMINLVPEKKEFLPHLEPLLAGLTENLKDLSSEVRAMAAKAFAALSKKFRDATGTQLLNSLKLKLESPDANSTERAGFAQAFAEVLVALGLDVTKELLPKALLLTRDSREHIRESFLSVFVYLPMVMGEAFVSYVAPTIETIVESIAHTKERIRNLSIKSLKIIIQGYLQNQFQVLLRPLFEGSISVNPNKRNSSLILLGDIIQMLMADPTLTKDFIYENYARIFSLFYIAKNDDDSEVRETAKNIYKTFVPNTQRCLRIIYKDLHDCFIDLFSREQEAVRMTASRGLREFGNKYSDTFAGDMLNLSRTLLGVRLLRHAEILEIKDYMNVPALAREASKIGTLLSGQSVFISQFVAKCNNAALIKIKNSGLLDVNARCSDFVLEKVWKEAFTGLRIFVERSGDVSGLIPRLKRYSEELSTHETVLSQKILSGASQSNEAEPLSEGEMSDTEYEKRKKFYTILLNSKKEAILRAVMGFLFKGSDFCEWQFEVILQNLKLFGDLLYENGVLKQGLSSLFECYKNKHALLAATNQLQSSQRPNFLTTNRFTINMLSVNVDPTNADLLIDELLSKLEVYQTDKNTPMLLLTLESLSYFFEKTPLTDSQFPLPLCIQVLNLSSYNGDDCATVFAKSGGLLEILFRLYDRENSSDVMFHLSESIRKLVDSGSSYEGLSDPKIFECLIKLILEVLVTSMPASASHALGTADFLLDRLSVDLFRPHESKLYAALLRVLIYRYRFKRENSDDLRKGIFEFLSKMLDAGLEMGTIRLQFSIYLIFLATSEAKTAKTKFQLENAEEEKSRIEKVKAEETAIEPSKTLGLESLPLLKIHLGFMLKMALKYECLVALSSQWGRKVEEDPQYYIREPLDMFVGLVGEQDSGVVSSEMKADLVRLVG